MSLVPVNTKDEASVVMLLERVHDWLATAVERSDASEIAAVKAQIATAAEATKQLNLSKEIQLDAQEMVRRAEYALGKAIRRGRDEGTILRHGESLIPGGPNATPLEVDQVDFQRKRRATDIASKSDLYGTRSDGAMALAAATASDFEEALSEAKEEGDLSRANVVRKVKSLTPPSTLSRQDRADLIEDLALQGYTSRQMPERVGVSEETIREIARAYDIEIPGDRTSLRTRRINPAQVVENTATALEGLAMGIGLIDCKDIDPALASQWVDSLTESMRALNRFVRQLKEQTQ